jgi:alcohol dehydrogenase
MSSDHRVNAAAPIVAYGDGAVERIPAHVAASGAQRVMLVCGRNSFEASGAAKMLPELERVATVLRWSDFVANTDSADLVRGLDLMREFEPDLVLGVGGGSAMDMAKLLCAFRDVEPSQVLDEIRAGFPAAQRREQLYLVPTTSGSGAEATHFAVVYIGADKYSIGGQGTRPDAIVLDPQLTLSGSAYQRATSGIDAVAQAIESMWATGATPRSRHFARVALRVLLPAIEPFVTDGDTVSARAMAIGSHFAGRAIDISRTTASHALSYGITKGYGISHGHAVAMTLGAFIESHADAGPASLRDGVDAQAHAEAMAEILAALGATDGHTGRDRFDALLVRIGLDPSLTAAGAADRSTRERLAASVNAERMGNNPVAFTAEQLADLVAALP